MLYAFTVEDNGQTYECEREVTGKQVFTQTIHVRGVGSKSDSASYSDSRGYHPPISMEGIARLIAFEIIREQGPKIR
jgi:hypothetical protein